MRKKIVGMSVVIALLAILCAQSVTAQNLVVQTWTDKLQYEPGEKGKVKISVLNETIPSDGTAIMQDRINIDIWTSEGRISGDTDLEVAAFSLPMSIVDLNTWMTHLNSRLPFFFNK